jgi:hypothetical protein
VVKAVRVAKRRAGAAEGLEAERAAAEEEAKAAAAAAAEAGEPEERRRRMLSRAHALFARLDADGDGVLDGDEVVQLADWLWTSFHPDGEEPSPDVRRTFRRKLVERLERDGRSAMTMPEFEEWALEKFASLRSAAVRRAKAQERKRKNRKRKKKKRR